MSLVKPIREQKQLPHTSQLMHSIDKIIRRKVEALLVDHLRDLGVDGEEFEVV